MVQNPLPARHEIITNHSYNVFLGLTLCFCSDLLKANSIKPLNEN